MLRSSSFAGKQLTSLQSVQHLGQLLTDDLRDNQAKSTDFIRKANSILVRFGTCTPPYVLLFDSIIIVLCFVVTQHGHSYLSHLCISSYE